MALMRVHAAVGQQADKVNCAGFLLRRREGCQQGRVVEEAAIRNRRVDARHVHAHDSPGPQIQVSNFAIAHLPIRQPHKVIARVQQRVRKVPQQRVIHRLACQSNRIAMRVGPVAPAVKNRENNRFRHVCSQNTKTRAHPL